ncbi:hypothetical protein PM082_015015 [Marasmius tenuissimus]|nr:hypothetical protein PM082_015015 [Marasmius tenuissimus]
MDTQNTMGTTCCVSTRLPHPPAQSTKPGSCSGDYRLATCVANKHSHAKASYPYILISQLSRLWSLHKITFALTALSGLVGMHYGLVIVAKLRVGCLRMSSLDLKGLATI